MADGQVDTSLYGTIGQNQPNFLGIAGQAANVIGAMNQNRLFQQEFQAKMALGPLIQQSVRPDGTIDWNDAAVRISTSPKTAFIAPQVLQQVAQKQLLDAQTVTQELGNAKARITAMGDAAAPLLAKGKDATLQDYVGAVTNAYTNGAFGPMGSQGAKDMALHAIQQGVQAGPDLQGFIRYQAMQADGASKSIDRSIGALQSTDVGTGTQFGYQGLGGYTPGAFIPKGLSTEEQNKLVQRTVTDPTEANQLGVPLNTQIEQPRAQVAPIIQGQPTLGQGAGVPSAGGGDQASQIMGQQPQTQGQAQPQPPRALVSGLSPFTADQQKVASDYKTDLNQQVEKMNTSQVQISNLMNSLQRVKTGGGASAYQEVGKILQALGINNQLVDQVANGSLADSQVVQNQAVGQIFSSLRDLINGAGRFAVLEFNVLKDNSPTIETDPRAWTNLIALTKRIYAVKRLEQGQFDKWVNVDHKDPSLFASYWANRLANSPLIKGPGVSDKQAQSIKQGLLEDAQ